MFQGGASLSEVGHAVSSRFGAGNVASTLSNGRIASAQNPHVQQYARGGRECHPQAFPQGSIRRERPPVPGVTRDTPGSASLGRTGGPKRGVAPVPTFAPGSAQRVDSGDRNPQRGEEMRGWHGGTRSGAFVEHGGWCPCSTRKCGLEQPKAVARSGLQRRRAARVARGHVGGALVGSELTATVPPLRECLRPVRECPAACPPGGGPHGWTHPAPPPACSAG